MTILADLGWTAAALDAAVDRAIALERDYLERRDGTMEAL